MGSISKHSAIGRFIDVFGSKIEGHFQHLVGSTITKMSNKEVSYHVKADITLKKDGAFEESFEVHHRWATQEENANAKEEDDYPMEQYFEDYLKGKTISKVYVGNSDRDDEVYLFAVADDEGYLEIPIGFDTQRGKISRIAEELIEESEFESFLIGGKLDE